MKSLNIEPIYLEEHTGNLTENHASTHGPAGRTIMYMEEMAHSLWEAVSWTQTIILY